MNVKKLVSIGSIFVLSLLFGLALMVTSGEAGAQQAPQAELQTSSISAIGSAFHYQGNLSDNGNPANGNYDIKFKLFGEDTGGTLIGEEVEQPNVSVQNGLFNAQIDFGDTAFDGTARFLEVSVRSAGQGDYLDLSPRQPILAVPMAQVAEVARQANSLAASTGITRVTVSDAGTLNIAGRDCCASINMTSGDADSSALLQVFRSGTLLRTRTAGSLSLGTDNKTRMLIDAPGNFVFGTAADNTEVKIHGEVTATSYNTSAGADLAEPFAFNKNVKVEPGTVVAIDPHNVGKLRVADSAYDKTVAGIVSGANGISAGIVMQHDELATDNDALVALSGRVYVKVDAQYGAIRAGDFLTTSDTSGHAMKASDHDLAQGAIIGKAMSSLDEGTGMVLVLVSLQ